MKEIVSSRVGVVHGAPTTFYQFLITYRSASVLGNATADLARDLREDRDAPRDDAALYQYLRHEIQSGFEHVVDNALRAYARLRLGAAIPESEDDEPLDEDVARAYLAVLR